MCSVTFTVNFFTHIITSLSRFMLAYSYPIECAAQVWVMFWSNIEASNYVRGSHSQRVQVLDLETSSVVIAISYCPTIFRQEWAGLIPRGSGRVDHWRMRDRQGDHIVKKFILINRNITAPHIVGNLTETAQNTIKHLAPLLSLTGEMVRNKAMCNLYCKSSLPMTHHLLGNSPTQSEASRF